jgi:hypothetical protein
MTSSPEMPVRLRFDLLEKWHVAQRAGNLESEPTAPDSDVRLGDGDSFSAMFGHAHGAQIPEAQEAAESNSLWKHRKPASSCPAKIPGNSRSRVFLRLHLRK